MANIYLSSHTGAELDNFLSKTGDTMTGALTINNHLNIQDANYIRLYTDINQNTTPDTTLSSGLLAFYTKDTSDIIGWLLPLKYNNGTHGLKIGCRKVINNENKDNALWLRVNNSGEPEVVVTEPEAWLSGLGLITTTSSTASNVIATNTANGSITTASYAKYGNIASIYVVWNNATAISVPANGNITNIGVGTLVNGLRPAVPMSGGWSHGDDAGAAWFRIDSNGNVYLGACEGTGSARTIAAGSRFDIHATFVTS